MILVIHYIAQTDLCLYEFPNLECLQLSRVEHQMTGSIYEEMGWKLLCVLLEEICCRKLITMLVISFGLTRPFLCMWCKPLPPVLQMSCRATQLLGNGCSENADLVLPTKLPISTGEKIKDYS